MVDAFGASRVQVRPPEKGVFPIDHDGECKEAMKVSTCTPIPLCIFHVLSE